MNFVYTSIGLNIVSSVCCSDRSFNPTHDA